MALKQDLVEKLAAKLGMTKRASGEALDLVFSEISNYLKKGEQVRISGFGNFTTKKRAARMGVNPRNPKQKITIKARKVPVFKAGKNLRTLIDK